MAIADYIRQKKAEFHKTREARQNMTYEKKQKALLQLQEKRKTAEHRARIDKSLAQEKEALQQLRKERLQRSPLGKGANVLKRLKNSTTQKKAFSTDSPGFQPFGPATLSSSPIDISKKETQTPTRPRKKKVIIYE